MPLLRPGDAPGVRMIINRGTIGGYLITRALTCESTEFETGSFDDQPRKFGNCSAATIRIFDPHDVILPGISPDLHLNQFEWDSAWIGKPVHGTNRNIGGLGFV